MTRWSAILALLTVMGLPLDALAQTGALPLDVALEGAGAAVDRATADGEALLLCRTEELLRRWWVYEQVSWRIDEPSYPVEAVHAWLFDYATSRCGDLGARTAVTRWWHAQRGREPDAGALALLGELDDEGCFGASLREPSAPPEVECGSSYLRDADGTWRTIHREAAWRADDPTMSCSARLSLYEACESQEQPATPSLHCPMPTDLDCTFPAQPIAFEAASLFWDLECVYEAASVMERYSERHAGEPNAYAGLRSAGAMYMELMDYAEAVRAYERLLELFPNVYVAEDVLRRLAEAEERRFNTDRAIEICLELDRRQREATEEVAD